MDHGALGHAHSLFAEVLEVPLIVHYPGLAPAVVSEPVATVDLFPTVLTVAGIEIPAGVVGSALFPPAAAKTGRLLFSETTRYGNLRSVVAGDLKLVKDLESGSVRLYDLGADPGETRDLAAERTSEAELLHGHLERWLRELEAGGRSSARIELTPEELERLEALGYGGD